MVPLSVLCDAVRAVDDGVGGGPTAVTDLWEWAGTCSTPRGLVETEADRSVAGLWS